MHGRASRARSPNICKMKARVKGNEESPVAGEHEKREEEDEGDHGAQAVPDANADGNIGDGDSGRT